MDLRRMAMFVAVVDSGSMRAAARQLGLTPSAVSQQIRQLEGETGVTLLQRSTRRLTLTEAGGAFYEGCAAMVAAARSAQARVSELHDIVGGDLTISAPVGFAEAHLSRALLPLLTGHPDLRLRLLVTDDALDLAKERIDVAITIGTHASATTLLRRHLANWDNILVAAPSYLATHGTPKTAADLSSHVFVALPRWHHPADVLTGPGGQRHRIANVPRITSNNQVTIRQFTLAGCGLSFGVVPEMAEELKAKRLVRVLRDWTAPQLSVDALMVPRTRQPAKVRAAVEALRVYLKGR
jgi:LysR family transcriptional regulator, transcriptional activator for aaeXAB operon